MFSYIRASSQSMIVFVTLVAPPALQEFRHELGLNSYLGTCSLGCVVPWQHGAGMASHLTLARKPQSAQPSIVYCYVMPEASLVEDSSGKSPMH